MSNYEIFDALHNNDMTELKRLVLEENATVNCFTNEHGKIRYGNTPLNHAISIEDQELIDLLFELGEDVNLAACDGWNVLLHAVEFSTLHFIKLLISKGANILATYREEGYNVGVLGRCVNRDLESPDFRNYLLPLVQEKIKELRDVYLSVNANKETIYHLLRKKIEIDISNEELKEIIGIEKDVVIEDEEESE